MTNILRSERILIATTPEHEEGNIDQAVVCVKLNDGDSGSDNNVHAFHCYIDIAYTIIIILALDYGVNKYLRRYTQTVILQDDLT